MRTAAATMESLAAVGATQRHLLATKLRHPLSWQVPHTTKTTTTTFGGCILRTRPSFIGLSQPPYLPTRTAIGYAWLQSPRPVTWGWVSRRAVRWRTWWRTMTSTFDVTTTCYLPSSWWCPASSYSAAFTQLLQLPAASRHQLGQLTPSPSRRR